jgi:hypothetical protein
MFQLSDIKQVQRVRPDLSDDQASEVLGFLCDMYSIEPFTLSGEKLFKQTADYVYPEEQK